YCMIPKLTFYETKKIMEGFVNEKVYDIDTKEKLLDIIQSKEARENFLEFIYDHHSELEKWQTYYQERSRIRIIEWLRNNNFHFVFEEDLDLPTMLIEKLKKELFLVKASKEILAARKILSTKAKTYYSNEALNPRPKRGRPPKQALKAEIEPQITTDIYITVPLLLRNFLFTPDLSNSSTSTFSSHFGNEDELFNRRVGGGPLVTDSSESINQKLTALRSLSNKWNESENAKSKSNTPSIDLKGGSSFDDFDDEDDEDDLDFAAPSKAKKINGVKSSPPSRSKAAAPSKNAPLKKTSPTKAAANKPLKSSPKSAGKISKEAKVVDAKPTKVIPQKAKPQPAKKLEPLAKSKASTIKAPSKKAPSTSTKKPLRSIMKLKRKSK
ncbi:MAG: hypothetical protein H0X29_12025, partial [Parachlamydiaceae bacterium]|nr:hypothetical protein [Parachlamydiaceae bacterium]